MNRLNILAYSGSTLLIGAPSQYQSHIGDELAFGFASEEGGQVIYLTDTNSEITAVHDRLNAWRTAHEVPIERVMNVAAIADAHRFVTGKDVSSAIKSAGIVGEAHNRLIVRDTSGGQALPPNAPWLRIASSLAHGLGCRVLTIGHHGPGPKPKFKDYNADVVLECLASHDLLVQVHRVKPAGSDLKKDAFEFKGEATASTAIVFHERPATQKGTP
jgi:hypothetical protein